MIDDLPAVYAYIYVKDVYVKDLYSVYVKELCSNIVHLVLASWVNGQLDEACCTLQDELQAFAIKYGTGQVAGYVDFDILKLGSPSLQITHQGFGEAYQASDDFSSTSCDGLFVSAQLITYARHVNHPLSINGLAHGPVHGIVFIRSVVMVFADLHGHTH